MLADLRMRMLNRAADDLERAKRSGNAEVIRATQLRFDIMHCKVFGNKLEPKPLQKSDTN